jgi:hypothetical protein
MIRRRRKSVITGLAFAAMAIPVTAGAAPYKDPSVPQASAGSQVLPSNFRSDAASNGSVSSSSQALPSNFRSDAASNGSASDNTSSSYTLPSNFRSEAIDGHAQQPAPTTVQVSSSSGFDWGDAGIGAAAIAGLLALCGGMTLLVTSHRRRSPGGPAVVS